MDMLVEECAELIKAVNKMKRNPKVDTLLELCGEIADVEIMIEQAHIIIRKDELIDNIKEEKLKRLEELLKK